MRCCESDEEAIDAQTERNIASSYDGIRRRDVRGGRGSTSATAKEHANITRGAAGIANHSIPALVLPRPTRRMRAC